VTGTLDVAPATVASDSVRLSSDGVYPEPFFRQRLEEEAHRAHRMHSLLTLILIQGDVPTLAHTLREGIRRMDVLGLWKGYLGVLMCEVPRDELSPLYTERMSLQAQGVLRIAGLVDSEWQEIFMGASLLPEQKSGRIDPGHLLQGAERALLESTQDHQLILFKGLRRYVDVPRTEGSTPTMLVRYGDLHYNKENHKAWIGSETVEFLPKEFDLLEYFLKHEGKLIRREQLSKAVWGHEGDKNSRTVDMHIAKLRKKLKTSRSISIRTFKGEGYRLDLSN
jgi:hypothetical protein